MHDATRALLLGAVLAEWYGFSTRPETAWVIELCDGVSMAEFEACVPADARAAWVLDDSGLTPSSVSSFARFHTIRTRDPFHGRDVGVAWFAQLGDNPLALGIAVQWLPSFGWGEVAEVEQRALVRGGKVWMS